MGPGADQSDNGTRNIALNALTVLSHGVRAAMVKERSHEE